MKPRALSASTRRSATILDDPDVIIGMILRGWAERAVAFDVSLRDCDREIVIATMPMVFLNPFAIIRMAGGREPLTYNMQRE